MRNTARRRRDVKENQGAAAVMTAICLTMLMGFAALAVDVGYMAATKNELQNVADAAALAGAGYIGMRYMGLSYDEQQNVTFTREEIVAAVQAVALQNSAAGVNIVILDEDIVVGQLERDPGAIMWNVGADGKPEIDPIPTPWDAVQVTARRDESANTPISTFFARIFGRDSVPLTADATAALTGPAVVDDGVLKAPFSLSEHNFPNNCTEEITFSPTTDSCAGWHNFFDPANAAALDGKMLSIIAGDGDGNGENVCRLAPCGQEWLDYYFDMNSAPEPETTPEAGIDDGFDHIGGNVASLFLGGVLEWDKNDDPTGMVLGNERQPAPFPALFDYFRYRDGDENNRIWTTTVPVYSESGDCANPTGIMPILGFATIVIRMPNPPPDTSVSVRVYCELTFVEGRGGGGIFGNLRGTIPNLIE